ncbi:hypothetical protein ABZ079_19745 [Streptomyces sp. NPDC006314]|uniref:hypothetical protein n=1 Tax=Streptomyces sp. NPDC006314 TaxID=3154475 RepID=UPI0033B905DE
MPSATRVRLRRRGLCPAIGMPAPLCLSAAIALLSAAPRAVAAGVDRPSRYAEGPPGAVPQDTVSSTHPGRTPVVVRLPGTGVRITFADEGPRVPAHTRAGVPVTVTVPARAEPGDRSGAILARDADGRTATVRLRAAGPALAALTVEHLSVHADRLTYGLVNRGTTVPVRLAVRVDGVLGRVPDRPPRLLPVPPRPGTRLKPTEPWRDRLAPDAGRRTADGHGPGRSTRTATVSARSCHGACWRAWPARWSRGRAR